MTTRDRFDRPSPEFDRLMTAWFDMEARVPEPDGLIDRVLARSSTTRPMPAWLLPERWLAMETTMRQVRLPRPMATVVLLILLAALLVVAVAIVGSRPRDPAPFGPAANGAVAYVDSGRITTLDPATGDVRVLFAADQPARYPTYSRDGRRVAFVARAPRGDGFTDRIDAVDVATGVVTPLTTEPLTYASLLTWSPDGSTLAFVDDWDLWLAKTDGSGAHKVDLGVSLADELAWLPPDGHQLVFRGIYDGEAGLYLADADGSNVQAITPQDGGDYDYLWVSPSPDGRRIAYHRVSTMAIEILTLGQATPVVVRPKDGTRVIFPRFSPDGTRIAAMIWDGVEGHPSQVGVFDANDPTPTVIPTGPSDTEGIQFDWSPDGSQILAVRWGSSEPWILDPDGGAGTRADWRIEIPDWVEWQRKAR